MPEPRDGTKGALVVAWKQEGEEKRECDAALKACVRCLTPTD